jgi:hypothetical protein
VWAVEGSEAQPFFHGCSRLTYAEVVFHILGKVPASLGFREMKNKGNMH